MTGFTEKYNTDDVFLRSLIAGLLQNLNDKLKYTQINDKQDRLEVYIPFFYSFTGDESFLQDLFINYSNCANSKQIAEGDYDIIPRGIVKIESVTINTQRLSNKFSRMSYTQEDINGQIKTFSSFTNSIPLDVSIGIIIKLDTMLDTFKIFQTTIETFYKTFSYSFSYGGFKINCQVGFPDNYSMEKQFDFSYAGSQRYIEFNFNVEIETYLPQKDLSTERFRGNLMQGGISIKNEVSNKIKEDKDKNIL